MINMVTMEENEEVVEGLKEFLGEESVAEARVPRTQRAFVTVKREKLRDAVKYLRDEEGFDHITTITGMDTGEELEVIYHLTTKDLSIALKTHAPYDDPRVPSITDLLNGAVLYEREVKDLVGIIPEGHPDPKRLILPDEWPDDVHPLLKKWDVESLRKKVDGEEW